jgi:hypothetical protein
VNLDVIRKNTVLCCETIEKGEERFFGKFTDSMTIFETMGDIDVDDVRSLAISSISQKSRDTHSPECRLIVRFVPELN